MKNVPTNLSNLENEVDQLNVDILVPVPLVLSKLSEVIKSYIVNDGLYNVKIKNIEDKIPYITNLATNTTRNAKINEVENKIPSSTNLGITDPHTAVENKIPDVSNLVKETNYNTKISETENKIITGHDHDKYIITQEIDKWTPESFAARLAQANLAIKSDIANFIKNGDFYYKLKNLNKHVLIEKQLSELLKKVKISTKYLIYQFSIFIVSKYFYSGMFQNYLVYIPAIKYIKYFSGTKILMEF